MAMATSETAIAVRGLAPLPSPGRLAAEFRNRVRGLNLLALVLLRLAGFAIAVSLGHFRFPSCMIERSATADAQLRIALGYESIGSSLAWRSTSARPGLAAGFGPLSEGKCAY